MSEIDKKVKLNTTTDGVKDESLISENADNVDNADNAENVMKAEMSAVVSEEETISDVASRKNDNSAQSIAEENSSSDMAEKVQEGLNEEDKLEDIASLESSLLDKRNRANSSDLLSNLMEKVRGSAFFKKLSSNNYVKKSAAKRKSAKRSALEFKKGQSNRFFGESGLLAVDKKPLVNPHKINDDSRSISEAVRELEKQHKVRVEQERKKALEEKKASSGLRINPALKNRSRDSRLRREDKINRQMRRFMKSVKHSDGRNILSKINEASSHMSAPMHRSRKIIMLSCLLAFSIIISLAALMPQFYVNEVLINGCIYLNEEDIRRVADVNPGTHFIQLVNGGLEEVLQARNSAVESKLKDKFPYISSVEAHIEFPSVFAIDIKESRELAYLAIPGGYAMLDSDGRVLQINTDEPPEGIPLIKGLEFSSLNIGEKINLDNNRSLSNALMLIDALLRADQDKNDGKSIMAMLDSVTLMDNQNIYLNFTALHRDRFFRVLLSPKNDYVNEVYWLRNAIRIGAFSGLNDGYLDLTGKNRVYVRLKNDYQGLMKGSDEIFSRNDGENGLLGPINSSERDNNLSENDNLNPGSSANEGSDIDSAIPNLDEKQSPTSTIDPFGNLVENDGGNEEEPKSTFELPNIDNVTVPSSRTEDDLFKNLN